MTRSEYIQLILKDAKDSCEGTGLFTSVTIAQAILETANGNSELSRDYHNHFGMKASYGWDGKIVNMKTREVFDGKSCYVNGGFRAYENNRDCFFDRVKFLKNNPRYTRAGLFEAKTPEAQAAVLQKSGYATDPDYAKLLLEIINGSSDLKQYDN